MEKYTPHYKLSNIKKLIEAGHVRSTLTALTNAAALGGDFNDMCNIVKSLTSSDFYAMLNF